MPSEGAADALRAELRSLLADIDDEIRTGFPASSSELTRRTCLAELSIVRDLVDLLQRALLGSDGRTPSEFRFSTPGQAYDLRDALAVAARSIVNERQRQEAELGTLQLAPWPTDLRDAFQTLIDEEQRVCASVDRLCDASCEHASALRTLVSNLCDVCLSSLAKAAALSEPAQRRSLGEAAYRTAERAAAAWLDWRAALEARQASARRACAPVSIPSVLVGAAASEKRASAFLDAIRRALHLRREQKRLVAAQRRLVAVLSAAEALAALQARIVVD